MQKREKIFLIIILSMTIVETFINLFFTVIVNDKKYSKYKTQILNDAKSSSFTLDKKIKEWPKLLFNRTIELKRDSGQEIMTLKKIRNKLIHFQPDYDTMQIDSVKIEDLVDISIYENLDSFDAVSCSTIILDFAVELFRIAGFPEDRVNYLIHLWFGDMSRRVLK